MENTCAFITKTNPKSCRLSVPRRNAPLATVSHEIHLNPENSKKKGNYREGAKKALVAIIGYVSFLFSPEDSDAASMDARTSRGWSVDLLSARTRVDIKAVFWIMASVLIAIQLARFGQ